VTEVIRENNPMLFKLWELKDIKWWKEEDKGKKAWHNFKIYADTTKDLEMNVWNGKHPVEENSTSHICKKGTKVLVWMVSRFGDVGVTDNLIDANGYHVRGLDPDKDLENYEFQETKQK